MNKAQGEMVVYINNPEIGHFILSHTGKIIAAKHCFEEIWEGAYLDMNTVKQGEKPLISYNKRENERIGLKPVYDYLQSNVANYITSINLKNNKS